MKKILMIIAASSLSFAAQAQQFNIGIGGGIYSTWLVNTNVSDQDDILDYAATFGGQLGLNTHYYFKDNLGISLGLLFTGHNQKYTGDITGSTSYETKTKLRYLDVPFLIRMGGASKGAYFELGPQFSFLMSAKDEYQSTPSTILDYTDKDRKDNFKTSGIAGVLGFGVDIDASENMIITTGLRLGYGFNDVTKEYTAGELLALGLTDNIGKTTEYAQYENLNQRTLKYAKTSRAFGGLFISVLYKL